jgi:hypothetical protein
MKRTPLLTLLASPLLAALGSSIVYDESGYDHHHSYWREHDRWLAVPAP